MRCLYCGKELALLKRWTGGGEFCSDAHRQRYQEEYNQLALNRLLQAKPPGKQEAPQKEDAKSAKPSAPEPVKEVPAVVSHAIPQKISAPVAPVPASLKTPEVKRIAQEEPPAPAPVQATAVVAPAQIAPPEEPAPAEAAGFLVEMPLAALAEVAAMSRPDLEFLAAVAAALPNRVFEPLNLGEDSDRLGTAGLLTFEVSNRASDYNLSGGRDRRLEIRDFVRTAPVVEIDLSPAGETGLETSSEAMDILIFPQPPQAVPVLWQQSAVGFAAIDTELGALARLTFATAGFLTEEETAAADNRTAIALAEPPEVVSAPDIAPVAIATELFPELREEIAVEPEPVAVQQPEPEPEPVALPEIEPIAEPVSVEARSPELVTKPLPLTLSLSAPGKGKPVQVFSSAANAIDAQVPRSSSLPLRATIVFGPAPAAAKPEIKAPEAKPETKSGARAEIKTEPKKPAYAPVRPDPRFAKVRDESKAAKNPAPEQVKPTAPAVRQAARTEVPGPPRGNRVDPKTDKKPEVRDNVKLKEEVKAAPVPPSPLAAPYSRTSDLGLPKLNLQSSGFLGQLPMMAKVGIVVVLLAGLGGLIAFSSKSGSATTTDRPGTIVAGSALPAGEAGWITDWGAEAGVRRTRQISILRSSQTLTDYRIEMNGQIESKAIGWVFRAQDPKNFYVTKLEIVKPGLQPTVALVRFAIINGEEQTHAQLPLPMKVSLDTMYKIRFDAIGDHFTTYVQDQKIDDWTDGHVKTGGVGFYRERGEDATLKGGMNVVPLIVRK